MRWSPSPLLRSYSDTRKKCALLLESCSRFFFLFLSLVCLFSLPKWKLPLWFVMRGKKANNPSLNNRAELKKKILAPGCPSASGPGIRLQLAQLHSLAWAIFSRKRTWYPTIPQIMTSQIEKLSFFVVDGKSGAAWSWDLEWGQESKQWSVRFRFRFSRF